MRKRRKNAARVKRHERAHQNRKTAEQKQKNQDRALALPRGFDESVHMTRSTRLEGQNCLLDPQALLDESVPRLLRSRVLTPPELREELLQERFVATHERLALSEPSQELGPLKIPTTVV